MRESSIPYFICPSCRQFLVSSDDQLVCVCGKSYSVRDGLIFLYDSLSESAQVEVRATTKEKNEQTELDERSKRIINLSHENAVLFLNKLNLNNKVILEIGAGNGKLSAILASRNICFALDINPIPKHEVFFERVIADMIDLPLADSSFDLVFFSAALHHSSNPEKTLGEVYRVLKSGGQLLLLNEPSTGLFGSKERKRVTMDKEHGFNEGRFSMKEWKELLSESGFETQIFLPENFSKVLKSRGMPGFTIPTFLKSFLGRIIFRLFDGFFNAIARKA